MGGVNLPPMNKSLRDVALIGLVIINLMALFPPWISAEGRTQGYHLILYAPNWDSTVNLARLAAQVLLVVSACAAVCLYLKRNS